MKTPFKNLFQFYFNYSKKDRNAILILASLILVFVILNEFIKRIEPKSYYNYSEYERIINKLDSSKNKIDPEHKTLFAFDPNTISRDSLDSLNIPEFVKNNIVSYRTAGGVFKNPQQLRKIYGMNDSIFERIQNFISIPEKKLHQLQSESKIANSDSEQSSPEIFKKETTAEVSKNNTTNVMVELNSADSSNLVQLNGVGPVFAIRILKYRNLLGGFDNKKQLLEVYGFPEETFQRIAENIFIDTALIQPIRINFAEYGELLRHPYIGKTEVNAILKHRENNGFFKNKHQLYSVNELDSVFVRKVWQYFTCR